MLYWSLTDRNDDCASKLCNHDEWISRLAGLSAAIYVKTYSQNTAEFVVNLDWQKEAESKNDQFHTFFLISDIIS